MRKIIGYFSLLVVIGISAIFLTAYFPSWSYSAFLAPHTSDRREIELEETVSLISDEPKHIQNSTIMLPNSDFSANMGIIVVPYFETTSQDWETIYSEADKYPGTIRYVIINPCSGPCKEPLSADWQQIITKLKSKNIKTLGYIFDTFQSKENIDYYMIAPQAPTDGIFFDNEGTLDTIDRFRQYADYVHSLGGIVYINPGFNYSYIGNYLKEDLADVANMYEFESSKSHHIDIDDNIQSRQVSAILGNVFTTSEMKQMIYESSQDRIGIIYVYSDSYYQLPSFFSELVKEAASTKVERGS